MFEATFLDMGVLEDPVTLMEVGRRRPEWRSRARGTVYNVEAWERKNTMRRGSQFGCAPFTRQRPPPPCLVPIGARSPRSQRPSRSTPLYPKQAPQGPRVRKAMAPRPRDTTTYPKLEVRARYPAGTGVDRIPERGAVNTIRQRRIIPIRIIKGVDKRIEGPLGGRR